MLSSYRQQQAQNEKLIFRITASCQSEPSHYKLLECYYLPKKKEIVVITEFTLYQGLPWLFNLFSYGLDGLSEHYSATIQGVIKFKPDLLNVQSGVKTVIVADQKKLEAQPEGYKNAIHFFSHDKSKKIENDDIEITLVQDSISISRISEEDAARLPRAAFNERDEARPANSDKSEHDSQRAAFY